MLRCKENPEELVKVENVRERRLEKTKVVNQEVREISREKVRKVRGRMKSEKAAGPNSLPVEAWRSSGEMPVG